MSLKILKIMTKSPITEFSDPYYLIQSSQMFELNIRQFLHRELRCSSFLEIEVHNDWFLFTLNSWLACAYCVAFFPGRGYVV